MKHKEQILKLRAEGKSYNEIIKLLGCSKGTVCYHLGKGQKQKSLVRQRNHKTKRHPFYTKVETFFRNYNSLNLNKPQLNNTYRLLIFKIKFFCNRNNMLKYTKPTFTPEDVINKFGETPKCYLTGEQIDIHKPRTYSFDHIIPSSKGGSNSIENLGICTKQANASKTDMTPDEYIELCKKILIHQGYIITKAAQTGIEPAT